MTKTKDKKNMDLSKRNKKAKSRADGKTYRAFSQKAKDRVFNYLPLSCLSTLAKKRQCPSVSKDAHGRVAELLADYVRVIVRDAAHAAHSRGKKTITVQDANTGISTGRDGMYLKQRPVVGII